MRHLGIQPHLFTALCAIATLGVPALSGCSSRPAPIERADVDVGALADAWIARLDGDGSATLNKNELAEIAAVEQSMGSYDQDGNGQVTAEEIVARLESEVFNPRLAFMQYKCIVQQNGKPIANAEVQFTPIDELTGKLPIAKGTSNAQGLVQPVVSPDDLPKNAPNLPGFMVPGIYVISVAAPSSGSPSTTVEISPGAIQQGVPVVSLPAK
ncbi:hypothetical protein [Aeoliella sp.]|uniref:hypothetical protein n=1 Tax=Aeoliella sp. TaxID=2795800 RepID=UPI003CCB9A82